MMNFKKRDFLFAFISMAFIFLIKGYDKQQLQKILDNKSDRTFLLSYPRSGNTWTRYCIEYITQRPSFNRFNFKHDINFPLGWLADFPIDINKSPIEKVHFANELKSTGANNELDALILIVRNPKETLVRHLGKTVLMAAVQENKMPKNLKIYFEALEIFDDWRSPKKMIIYYEDLLQAPESVLLEILAFLNESTDKLQEFLNDYANHKKKCLSLYKESASAGNDLLFHSKSLSAQERTQIDMWAEKQFPILWEKYLKNRYAEAILKTRNMCIFG